MTMSQVNSLNDKDQPQAVGQQLQCDTTYFNFSKVEQSHQERNQEQVAEQLTSKRSRQQLSEAERAIVDEIDRCLKDWYDPWKQTYLDDGPEFKAMYDLMEGLLHYQDQILGTESMLPADRSRTIAQAVARLVDYGNAILDIDIVLRVNDGSLSEHDPTSMTTIELYQAHMTAHRLRDKLLRDYFKTAANKQRHATSESDSPTGNPQQQYSPAGLRVPTGSSSTHPSPVMDRSQRFSIGSHSSINTLVPSNSNSGDGRRTPQSLNSSLIEVKTMSSMEDLTESQLEMRHLIATLNSGAFREDKPSQIRVTLLQATLNKVESLLSLPTSAEKLTNCFELMDTLLNSIETIPSECRHTEVQMIANSLLETLVRKVYVDDRDNYVEFQRSRWSTYLITLIRLMSASDFNQYLRKFTNSPDLSAFLRDYLFVIKRLISRPNEADPLAEPAEPIYPGCWIEMTLLVCSTLLKSLIYLYQILRQAYPSNVPMWLSYIDCLMHFNLQEVLKPSRKLFKHRQALLIDDLRKTAADYVWITWDSLSSNQKYDILEDIIEPLLRVCLTLSSRQRSILLPIFYDMMQCDYTSQYISPRGTICGSESICSQTTVDRIGERANYIYEAELEQQLQASRKQTSGSNDSAESDHLITANQSRLPLPRRVGSEESLPYLSLRDPGQLEQPPMAANTRTSASDDGTVLTKFTHLIVGKLYDLMVEMNLGDAEFKLELCSAISGELTTIKYHSHQLLTGRQLMANDCQLNSMADASQFKCMAKHTANLIAEFIQICLDSRQANKLSYNHLHLLCLFKLILFFRDKVDRIELYLANLHKLWRLHHNAGRFIEAGFTLLEHAKSLPWLNKPLEGHYRIMTRSFQSNQPLADYMSLKLFLYTTIIEYFDQGQLWEAAVPLCRELIDVYQFRLFDYAKLAQLLAKLSAFFSNISSGQVRSQPEYFRVTFYGIGFPECLRNTTMIYRGKPFERLSDFQATLLSKYPDAKLLRTLEQPDESLLIEHDAKYLQINACTPVVDLKNKINTIVASSPLNNSPQQQAPNSVDRSELHDPILAYYRHNECDKFEFSRRMANVSGGGGGGGGGDDFANMWRQRITLTTNSLPGMLPFFCVFLQETNIISPIECAIEDLERANDRLASMVNRFKADKQGEEDARPLGQLLLGIVDAAVNGGITKYEEAFFAAADQHGSVTSKGGRNNNSRTTHSTSNPAAQVPLGLSSSSSTSSSSSVTAYGLHDGRAEKHLTPPSAQQHVFGVDQYERQPVAATYMMTDDSGASAPTSHNAPPTQVQVERLKRLIANQVPLLDEAIKLHAERVADVMRPQHEHLEASYKRLKHHIMSKYSRHLPAHYHRNSSFSCASASSSYLSNTLRTYRSLARSPNRSIRSESRVSAALAASSTPTGDRFYSKRMSDVGRGGAPVVVKVNDGLHDDEPEGAAPDATNIPYKQLNNERRSLPFLAGISALRLEENSSQPPRSEGPPLPPLPDRRQSRPVRNDKIVPPPPRASEYAALGGFEGPTYVSLSEIKQTPPLPPQPPQRIKTSAPSQFNEAPYARLLQHDDDDEDDDDDVDVDSSVPMGDDKQQHDGEVSKLVTI